MKGKLIIIVGPSASGKTVLVRALLERLPGSARLVTVTTRSKRPGEVEGKDYYFVTRDEFAKRIEQGDFLEYAEVYGNLYGQSRQILDECLQKYSHVFAIIDVKGAHVLKEKIPGSFTVFINPGSLEEIRSRLRTVRAGISEDELERRLATASEEMAMAGSFDAVIDSLPGKFSEAVEGVTRLLK